MFTELIHRLGLSLPVALVEELELHKEKQKNQNYFLRLMEADEIVELVDYMSKIEAYRDMIPLWSDDHSNYIGLYVQGACKYRICYIDHEETDVSPAFRSIRSFITKIEEYPDLDWHDLNKDYPAEFEVSQTEMNEDLACIDELNRMISSDQLISDDIRCQYIFSIMALTPKGNLNSIIKYLDDEDMFVQERACEIIGFHTYIPAKEKLVKISKNGMHNGKIAAKRALERIREDRKNEI
ncbi:HEAT repeat domain-containing protein [Paenibacillus sp. FSL R7-0210]|uniref:HEAT repeat domain-containing protein n=1 Tax=Paenibacillus sp. FSL R7-0210 TaxID=2921676 RepID=UPI0030F86FAC